MVRPHLFCLGNGDLRRSSSAESDHLRSNSYLPTETEKAFNMHCGRLNGDARWSCACVENGLANSQPLRSLWC